MLFMLLLVVPLLGALWFINLLLRKYGKGKEQVQ